MVGIERKEIMEPIMNFVNNCQKTDTLSFNGTSEQAMAAGFTKIAKGMLARENGYIPISEDRIKNYLLQKVDGEFYCSESLSDGWSYIECRKWVGKFLDPYWLEIKWLETVVESYDKIPPSYVFEKLRVARNHKIFDYFTVATVSAVVKVKDPLLLGRINGDTTRYFIAQWDDDIKLDNLI